MGVAASGRDELCRYPLVLAPKRVIEALVKTPLRCRGIVQQHKLDVSNGKVSAHLSKFIEIARQRNELRHDDVVSCAQVSSRHLQAETAGRLAGFLLPSAPTAE